jgi:capsular polysaccharide export protein
VVDRDGIYYDPTGPSELERILQEAAFSDEERERARALRERIVRSGLSKYNVGQRLEVEVPAGRRVVLVPGQVEDDASVRLGCRDVRTNAALVAAARRDAPGAFVIFKPHPDVLSGNRVGRVDPAALAGLCDHVEARASLADCLAVSDEVHTLTSLVGFEALLRGLRVVVHGQPFYAGWGLTEDRHPVERRTRRLDLDELVAGALIRYPRYLHRETGRFTTPEVVIAQLLEERDRDPAGHAVSVSWPRRQLRKLVHAYRGVIHAP